MLFILVVLLLLLIFSIDVDFINSSVDVIRGGVEGAALLLVLLLLLIIDDDVLVVEVTLSCEGVGDTTGFFDFSLSEIIGVVIVLLVLLMGAFGNRS